MSDGSWFLSRLEHAGAQTLHQPACSCLSHPFTEPLDETLGTGDSQAPSGSRHKLLYSKEAGHRRALGKTVGKGWPLGSMTQASLWRPLLRAQATTCHPTCGRRGRGWAGRTSWRSCLMSELAFQMDICWACDTHPYPTSAKRKKHPCGKRGFG